MELYVLRHAIAVERGTPGYDRDSDRPLTPEGEKRMRRAAQGMKALNLSFDLILTSPYLRTRQTADIVAQVLGAQDRIELTEALAPDGDPEQLIGEIRREHRTSESVLLVGHEPYLSCAISRLLVGDENLSLVMKKGSLCKLTIHTLKLGRGATLHWVLTPGQLRRLASGA